MQQRILVASLILSLSAAALADDAQSAAQRCATIADATARLACYDTLFRPRVGEATPSQAEAAAAGTAITGAGAGAGASTVPAAAATTSPAAAAGTGTVHKDEFGLSGWQKQQKDPQAKVPANQSLTAKVDAVGHQHNGFLIVTLENGQVWNQIEATALARVAPGESVTIRPAALGSYLMVTPNGVATRVRRVR